MYHLSPCYTRFESLLQWGSLLKTLVRTSFVHIEPPNPRSYTFSEGKPNPMTCQWSLKIPRDFLQFQTMLKEVLISTKDLCSVECVLRCNWISSVCQVFLFPSLLKTWHVSLKEHSQSTSALSNSTFQFTGSQNWDENIIIKVTQGKNLWWSNHNKRLIY